MNTLLAADDTGANKLEKPGEILASQREQKGYSVEYVASKLHLRVRIIELLESDQYTQLPEPVFIKGYLRAYARLLEISSAPLLEIFNSLHNGERKIEKALWQSRRAPQRAEHIVRWLTGSFALIVIIAVIFWWQNNKENEKVFSPHLSRIDTKANNATENDIRLTDLSKMRSLLSSTDQTILPEKTSD